MLLFQIPNIHLEVPLGVCRDCEYITQTLMCVSYSVISLMEIRTKFVFCSYVYCISSDFSDLPDMTICLIFGGNLSHNLALDK